jgi:hypothetical protein
MSIRTHVAGCFCVALAGGIAGAPDAAAALNTDPRPGVASATIAPQPPAPAGGLRLDRLSKGDRRLWRAIEEVVAASDAAGAPRSSTLRRLWEWARTSPHVLHVEMVPPSKLAAGMVGVFRVESFDPEGLRHVGVIRLCPINIRRGKVSAGLDPAVPFLRFAGLTDAERFAEVLAHELAHAEYSLESPERLAEVQAAQAAIEQTFSRAGRAAKPLEELVRQSAKPLAVLAAGEAHAESVEAVVLRELAERSRLLATTGRVR